MVSECITALDCAQIDFGLDEHLRRGRHVFHGVDLVGYLLLVLVRLPLAPPLEHLIDKVGFDLLREDLLAVDFSLLAGVPFRLVNDIEYRCFRRHLCSVGQRRNFARASRNLPILSLAPCATHLLLTFLVDFDLLCEGLNELFLAQG